MEAIHPVEPTMRPNDPAGPGMQNLDPGQPTIPMQPIHTAQPTRTRTGPSEAQGMNNSRIGPALAPLLVGTNSLPAPLNPTEHPLTLTVSGLQNGTQIHLVIPGLDIDLRAYIPPPLPALPFRTHPVKETDMEIRRLVGLLREPSPYARLGGRIYDSYREYKKGMCSYYSHVIVRGIRRLT